MSQISKTTRKNWEKLKVNENEKKLDSRANKTKSQKKIIPVELFLHKKNIEKVKIILEKIKKIKNNNLKEIMHNLSLSFLINNKLLDNDLNTKKENVKKLLFEYNKINIYKEILEISLPKNEKDILGIIYQSLQNEGNKNKSGSYYTPNFIVKDMLKNIKLENNKTILDPCCGTGMFLLGLHSNNPENIYGFDIDEIAIEIAKVNLIVKYKNFEFSPNILKKDYFNDKIDLKFDYIITNPPWGAKNLKINIDDYKELKSKESFSYALYKSINILKNNGKIVFLLPESFLNVKTHSDIRKYILENISFEKIVKYSEIFTGVVTKVISIVLKKSKRHANKIKIFDNGIEYFDNVKDILNNKNKVITINMRIDKNIIDKIYSKKFETLGNSIWGLGIVTGNNKEKLLQNKKEGYEKIYTGKEVSEYKLLPCKNYIKYIRENLQQVAPDEIYRAPEKFAYKFISKKLVFAYDNTGSLFLNSANVLIPKFKNVTNKVALALLNSTIFQYLYIKKFGEIKILRGNLEQLPFTIFSEEDTKNIEEMVEKRFDNKIGDTEINNYLYKIYNLKNEEINYIEEVVNGKVN